MGGQLPPLPSHLCDIRAKSFTTASNSSSSSFRHLTTHLRRGLSRRRRKLRALLTLLPPTVPSSLRRLTHEFRGPSLLRSTLVAFIKFCNFILFPPLFSFGDALPSAATVGPCFYSIALLATAPPIPRTVAALAADPQTSEGNHPKIHHSSFPPKRRRRERLIYVPSSLSRQSAPEEMSLGRRRTLNAFLRSRLLPLHSEYDYFGTVVPPHAPRDGFSPFCLLRTFCAAAAWCDAAAAAVLMRRDESIIGRRRRRKKTLAQDTGKTFF